MRLRPGSRFKGTKKQKATAKGKTRLHLAYTEGKPFPDGLTVAGIPKFRIVNRFGAINRPVGAWLVNTGKNYSSRYPASSDPQWVATATRDVRGHGYNTSRVKRALRAMMQSFAEMGQ